LPARKLGLNQPAPQVGHKPERVTTDGHDGYPRAIRRAGGRNTVHRTSQYLNNRLEHDHRAVKQCYYPMRGFGAFASTARFCTAFDELCIVS
jgi:transposase-like protein